MPVTVRTVGTPAVGETSNPTVSRPAGLAGDLLVMVLLFDNDTTDSMITTPSGTALHFTSAIQYLSRMRVFSVPYEDAASSYSWSINGAHQITALPLVLAGVDLSGSAANRITGASTPAGSTGSTSTSTASSTTGADGGLLLSFGAALRYNTGDSGQMWTLPAGFTEHFDQAMSWQKGWIGSRPITADGATGSTVATAAASHSAGWTAGQVAFRPAPAAPSGPEPGRAMLAT